MSQRLRQLVPRILSAGILVNLLLLLGCGGTAGIENGQVIGKVFSNLRGNTASRNPEPGVTVVVESQGSQRLIRNAVTDSNGVFVFPSLPVGEYQVGFAKEGFITISTASGNSASQTAIGNQVRVVVEPGRTSVAPDVTMRASRPTGNITVITTILDESTGQVITNATVSSTGQSVTENADGVYTLSIPIIPAGEQPFGSSSSVFVDYSAEGFEENQFFRIDDPFPGNTYRFTQRLAPLTTGRIEGTYRMSKFQAALKAIRPAITIKDFGSTLGNSSADPNTGTWFFAGLPPSTSTITRQFDLVFSHPDLKTYTLQRVVMPKDGTKTITAPVILEPIVVDVVGTVFVSHDAGVTQLVPNGADDKVWIVETGQTASVVNGQFLIPGVPVRQAPGDVGWTLKIVVTHPTQTVLYTMTADPIILPVSNAAATPSNCPDCAPQTYWAGIFTAKRLDP